MIAPALWRQAWGVGSQGNRIGLRLRLASGGANVSKSAGRMARRSLLPADLQTLASEGGIEPMLPKKPLPWAMRIEHGLLGQRETVNPTAAQQSDVTTVVRLRWSARVANHASNNTMTSKGSCKQLKFTVITAEIQPVRRVASLTFRQDWSPIPVTRRRCACWRSRSMSGG